MAANLTTKLYFGEPGDAEMIAFFVGLSLITTFHVYLLSALVAAGLAKRKEARTKGTKTADWMIRWLIMASSVTVITSCTACFASYALERSGGKFCYIAMRIKSAAIPSGFFCAYGAIWLRQHSLYRSRFVAKESSPALKILSWASGASIVMLPVCMGPTVWVTETYYDDCWAVERVSRLIVVPIAVLARVLANGLQIFLFVTPLLRHRRRMKGAFRRKNGGAANVVALLKRALVSSLACFITDVLSTAVPAIRQTMVSTQQDFIINLNGTVNTLCTLTVFSEWKAILLFRLNRRQKIAPIENRTRTTAVSSVFSATP